MKLKHCWHGSSIQHAMMNHRDLYCCFCNKHLCVLYNEEPDPNHGPHSLPVLVMTDSAQAIVDAECPSRVAVPQEDIVMTAES